MKTASAEVLEKHRVNFSDGNRTAHLQALSDWLSPDLRDMSLIDWNCVI